MRYLVDEALCAGHGLCAAAAGSVFALDEDGYNRDTGRAVEVPAPLETLAGSGARACPEQAIRLLG